MSLENYDCTATVKRWRRLSQRHLHRLICCSRGSPHAPSKFATLHHLECFPHEDAQGPGVLVPLPALGSQQERRRKRLASGCCNIRSGPQGGGLESSTLPAQGKRSSERRPLFIHPFISSAKHTEGLLSARCCDGHQGRPSSLPALPEGCDSNVIFSVKSPLGFSSNTAAPLW